MSFIDTVLKARTFSELGLDWKEAVRLVHPDVCKDPRAGEAFARLSALHNPPPTAIDTPLGKVVVRTKIRDGLWVVEGGLLTVRRDRNKKVLQHDGIWTLDWKQFRIRKGTEHFPAAVCRFSDDAHDIVSLAPYLGKLPIEHATWVLRRGLIAYCKSPSIGPFDSVFIGPRTRAWVWTETGGGTREDYKRFLTEVTGTLPLLQKWLRGAVSVYDPEAALFWLNKLIDDNMKRVYTPLDIQP